MLLSRVAQAHGLRCREHESGRGRATESREPCPHLPLSKSTPNGIFRKAILECVQFAHFGCHVGYSFHG